MANKDALELLKDDHEKVAKYLDKLASTTERGVQTRRDLLDKIDDELRAHMAIEEEIFYPAFRDACTKKGDERMYYEAKEEHHAAAKVLSDLKRADVATAAFGGKAKVLCEMVGHHVDEEEEEIFPRMREVFSKEDLVELGERMQERKDAIQKGRMWDSSSAEARA